MQDRYGTYLNDAIAAMRRDRTVNAFDMLQSYFVGLSTADSEPSLRRLTATAIEYNVQVLACDMDYKDAQKQLSSPIAPLFVGEGLSLRDKGAATMIARRLKIEEGMEVGRLMLWGANHFTENEAFTGSDGTQYPDTRLQTFLREKGLAVHVALPEEIEAAAATPDSSPLTKSAGSESTPP